MNISHWENNDWAGFLQLVIMEGNEASKMPLALYHSSVEDIFTGFHFYSACGRAAKHRNCIIPTKKNLHYWILAARDFFPPFNFWTQGESPDKTDKAYGELAGVLALIGVLVEERSAVIPAGTENSHGKWCAGLCLQRITVFVHWNIMILH